jgi:hypothetical protein
VASTEQPDHTIIRLTEVALFEEGVRDMISSIPPSDHDLLRDFVASIGEAPAGEQEKLRRAAQWVEGLLADDLVRLHFSSQPNKTQWTLRVRPRRSSTTLAAVFNDGAASIGLWRSVFERIAPGQITAIEKIIAPVPLAQGNATRDFSDQLFDALTTAYREAAGSLTPSSGQTAPGWSLRPGQTLRRSEIHSIYGGSGRGGMAPSRSTRNMLLFTDPAIGNRHGYYDGWVGEVFHYTGMGQHGDQELKSGNRALLRHEVEGRAVRLFRGVGGQVMYLGEFRVDPVRPYYRMDAPETGGGETRQVIVFRLLPVGDVVHVDEDDLRLPGAFSASEVAKGVSSSPEGPMVVTVAVEAQHNEEVLVNPSAAAYTSVRREQKLVLAYKQFIETKGSIVTRFRIQPTAEAKPLLSDVYDETRQNLLEAKGTGSREAIRMAIGQLADYGRFTPPEAAAAVLLPARPRHDLEELLSSQGISCVWQADSTFEDNASGRFT